MDCNLATLWVAVDNGVTSLWSLGPKYFLPVKGVAGGCCTTYKLQIFYVFAAKTGVLNLIPL